mmetsp:Transcript_536/g.1171  ORF Transcript_536/g.1171 Transcript_536/m.1171 type:complete len:89 (-) Transcript_536:970-1236(-)
MLINSFPESCMHDSQVLLGVCLLDQNVKGMRAVCPCMPPAPWTNSGLCTGVMNIGGTAAKPATCRNASELPPSSQTVAPCIHREQLKR